MHGFESPDVAVFSVFGGVDNGQLVLDHVVEEGLFRGSGIVMGEPFEGWQIATGALSQEPPAEGVGKDSDA